MGVLKHNFSCPFECPNCDAKLKLVGEFAGMHVEVWDDEAGEFDWEATLAPSQIETLRVAESTGLLHAFTEARKATPQDTPKNMGKVFLDFLSMARPKYIPSFALNHFISEFGGRIEFHVSNGVGVVLSDNALKAFIPSEIVQGAALRQFGTNRKSRAEAIPERMFEWMRTKRGLVPVDTPNFMDALRKNSIGDFARPVL